MYREKHFSNEIKKPEMGIGRQILVFTLCFIVSAASAYILYILMKTMFLTNSKTGNKDGFTQIYPSYVGVKHVVQGLLQGKGLSAWNWTVGLGADNWNTYAAKLANPFTYLIIAVPEKYIDISYSLVAILKQYCAGIAFMFFGRKMCLNSTQNILGGLCYALSNWMLWTATAQSGFATAAILFPLLMLGAEKIMDRESPLLFIIAVFYYLTSGVVWGYAAGIMVIFYYLLKQLVTGRVKEFKGFLKTTGTFILCGIAGILLASFFVSSILTSMSNATTNSGMHGRTWYTMYNYLSVPRALYKISATAATSYSAIGLPVAAVLTLPIIVGKAFKGKIQCIMAALCLIGTQIPAVCRFFNGLSYTSGRWFFMVAFFFVWAAVTCLDTDVFKSRVKCIIMELWLVLSAGWVIVEYMFLELEGYKSYFCARTAIIFGTVIILTAHLKAVAESDANKDNGIRYLARRTGSLLIIVITMLNIAELQIIKDYYNPLEPIYGHSIAGEIYDGYQSTGEAELPEIQEKDNGFWRYNTGSTFYGVRRTGAKPNASLIYNTRPIYSFSSTNPLTWQQFNASVGNAAGNYRRTVINGNDERPILDYLLGTKYFIGSPAEGSGKTGSETASAVAPYGYELNGSVNGFDLFQNKYCMGLGTTYDKYITKTEFENYPVQVREQVLMQAAVVPDGFADDQANIHHAAEEEIVTTLENIEYSCECSDGIEIDTKNKTITVHDPERAYINFKSDSIKDRQVLLSFENLKRESMSYDENQLLRFGATLDPEYEIFKDKVKKRSYKDKGSFKISVIHDGVEKATGYDTGRFRMSWPHNDFDINIGYFDDFDGAFTVKISNAGIYHYDSINVYAVPMDLFDEGAALLDSRRLDISDWSDDCVKGTMSCAKDSIMYFSILKNKGWNIYVDGEKAEKIDDVNVSFTGAVLSAGEHQVELRYEYPYKYMLIAATLAGLLLTVGIMIRYSKNKKHMRIG